MFILICADILEDNIWAQNILQSVIDLQRQLPRPKRKRQNVTLNFC
jgi:hypothetical protein